MLSIIIPAFNEADNIQGVIDELGKVMAGIEEVSDFEIIVVDDHSSDETREKILELNRANVHCIRLSRRSGSHAALRAGMAHARGGAALLIAADGQDTPDTIREMIRKWKSGRHSIWALRKHRSEPFMNMIFAKTFYWLLGSMLDSNDKTIDFSRMGFFLLDRKVLDAINACSERNTSLAGLMAWVGFDQDVVEYEPRPRQHGRSKWNFRTRMRAAKDWIIGFSGLPLKLMTLIGFIVAVFGFIAALIIGLNGLKGHPIPGWTSQIVVAFVLGGIQILFLGIMGEYIWRNLDESRRRPLYFIESNTLEETR